MDTPRYKFEILIGMHFSEGQRHDARDARTRIINTDIDLAKKFGKEKFKLLVDTQAKKTPTKKVTSAKELDKGQDVPEAEKTEEPEIDESEIEEPEIEDELKSEDELDVNMRASANHLVAVHRGAGRYAVVDARTDEPIHDGTMSKQEARALAED